MGIRENQMIRVSDTDLLAGEIVTPEDILWCEEEIDGYQRSWEEYVPSGYTGEKKVPLVISLHGGAVYTMRNRSSWIPVAERENFILVFPHSLAEGKVRWNAWNEFTREEGFPDDVAYLDYVLETVLKKYQIDQTRIYIHGQSVGDKMASTYIFERGDRFAAAACLSGTMGASCFVDKQGELFYGPQKRLPVVRRHGTEDLAIPLRFNQIDIKYDSQTVITEKMRRDKMLAHQIINNHLWKKCNGVDLFPRFILRDKFNIAYYPGNPYDYVFYAENGIGHTPEQDMADYIWSYFFTRYQRVNGQIKKSESKCHLEPDENCTAIAAGSDLAYVNHVVKPLDNVGSIVKKRMDKLSVPVKFFEEMFDAKVTVKAGMVWIEADGHILQAAKGNRTIIFDDHYYTIGLCFEEDGVLYLPVSDVMRRFGYKPLEAYDVVYVTKEDSCLSYDFAYLIKEILKTEKTLSTKECLDIENQLIEEWIQSGGLVYDKSSLPKN